MNCRLPLPQQLTATLKTLKASGVSILLVEQNAHLALSDHAFVIADGQPFTQGPSVAADSHMRKPISGFDVFDEK
jgi:ABC-type branched-subunit amino acid transport system ATPase component